MFGFFDHSVDQMNGLAGAGRGPERRCALELQEDSGGRDPELQGHADGRDARIGGLLVSAQLADHCLLTVAESVAPFGLHNLEHELGDRLILDESFGIRAASRFESESIDGQRDLRLHIVVGALRSVGHDQIHPLAQRHQHCEQRLVQRSDLVGLDQGRVDKALAGGGFDGLVVGGDQVVTDDEYVVAQSLEEQTPTLVVVLRETVLDRQQWDLILLDRLDIDVQDGVPVEDDLGLVPPEEVHPDAVWHIEFRTVGVFELAHRRIKGDRHIDARLIAALGDCLLHHRPQTNLGKREAALFDVRGEPPFEADAHDPAALFLLDDFFEAILQANRQFLRVLIVPCIQDQEHRLLHADIGLWVLVFGVPAAHSAIAKLPRCGDRS